MDGKLMVLKDAEPQNMQMKSEHKSIIWYKSQNAWTLSVSTTT